MKYRDLKEPLLDLGEYLLIISLPANKQIEIHGIGNPASEMQEYLDFDICYDSDILAIKEQKLLSQGTISKVENFISQLKSHKPDFWTGFQNSTTWDHTREAAKTLLKEIGVGELKIVTEYNKENTDSGIVEFNNLFVIIEKDCSKQELEEAIIKFKNDRNGII